VRGRGGGGRGDAIGEGEKGRGRVGGEVFMVKGGVGGGEKGKGVGRLWGKWGIVGLGGRS